MKALTIHQPYAQAIVRGYKPVENRTWRPPIGGRILIHAGLKKVDELVMFDVAELAAREQEKTVDEMLAELKAAPRGCIVGSARVRGFITPTGVSSAEDAARLPELLEQTRSSDWYTGPIGWVLGDVVEYERPVACRGMQSLWRPDAGTLAMCVEQEKGEAQRWTVATEQHDPREVPVIGMGGA